MTAPPGLSPAPALRAVPPAPMRASAGPPPPGTGWAVEFAWDGLRCLVHAEDGRLRLLTEAGRDVAARFPELDVLAPLVRERALVLDGVVVAFDERGRPDRARLSRRHRAARPSGALRARVPVSLFVFDVLAVDGRSTTRLPYRQRRAALLALELSGPRVVVPPSFTAAPARSVAETARRYGLDGIVSKRLESTYQPGRRSRSWIETAVRRTQEVVVGGWVPGPRRSGSAVDPGEQTVTALLVGVPSETGLRYAGRVGAGLTVRARRELLAAGAGLERPRSPFDGPLPDGVAAAARWLSPRLLGTVEHRRWTAAGLVDRAVWQGLHAGGGPDPVVPPVLTAPVVATDLALDDLEPVDREGPGRAGAERETVAGIAPPGSVPAARTVEVTPPAAPAPTADPGPDRHHPGDDDAALRSRFSQHFVHNTLTAISAYVRIDPGRARDLLGEFADFTRYSFRSAGEPSTVGEELANAEGYLTLESARFGSRLRIEVSTAAEVAAVAVPPFVVAPLVENAVRHGIEPCPAGGTVSVHAFRAGGDCVITVADDGVGMGPEAGWLTTASRRGGVPDVTRRLREEFGARADLNVDSRPEQGTTVRLRFPVGVPAAAGG